MSMETEEKSSVRKILDNFIFPVIIIILLRDISSLFDFPRRPLSEVTSAAAISGVLSYLVFYFLIFLAYYLIVTIIYRLK